jgi:hypothetical protein
MPIVAGNHGLTEMFDPIGHPGLTFWLCAATILFYGLAYRALRRLEP